MASWADRDIVMDQQGRTPNRLTEHATCIALGDKAVLLRGRSGAGKSDLGLRLIDGGAHLVSDDQTVLERLGERVLCSPPPTIAGKYEVRGLGILAMEHRTAALALVVDLVAPEEIERMPEIGSCDYLGLGFPRIALAPFEASAPAKLRMAAERLCR
ncbi:MAG: HPr kinase/phosphatase C-terminal domain-containing protein [Rhodospirillales bacterium]